MEYQKTAEATGDLMGNKIPDVVQSKTLATQTKSYDGKITKVSISSPQKNSETITSAYDKEIPK